MLYYDFIYWPFDSAPPQCCGMVSLTRTVCLMPVIPLDDKTCHNTPIDDYWYRPGPSKKRFSFIFGLGDDKIGTTRHSTWAHSFRFGANWWHDKNGIHKITHANIMGIWTQHLRRKWCDVNQTFPMPFPPPHQSKHFTMFVYSFRWITMGPSSKQRWNK